ncbi:MAG: hypothetical protein D6772_00520 [Bacteroidetes bacterium]|nr:MAG: hypothetical protein D6772_00520 [Bacteroidota bacterium]
MKNFFGDHHGLDERSMDSLLAALERENLPGFDYLEFKQSLARLQELGMDEATAFKSAFATASTMGLTKEKLLKTAAHYKQVLGKEKKSFDAALQKQMKARVEGKRQEVQALRQKVKEYEAKIAELEAKLAQAREVIASADQDIAEAQAGIEQVQERFQTTLQALINQIDQDVKDIENYL